MANVKSVKELILDEKKLVTYVSISKELCIHVNESKTLLGLAVEEIKEKHPEITLNVNFIISGSLTNNSARTLICSEADLDNEKAKFRTIFFLHIYSVSQGLTGVDDAAIVSVNSFDDFPLCTGLVKSSSCAKRTLEELGSLKSKSVTSVVAQSTAAPKTEKSKDAISNGTDKTKPIVKAHTTKSEPAIKTEKISPKKDTHSSLSNGKTNITNGKKTKGIAGFFSKANSAPTIKTNKPAKVNGIKKEAISQKSTNDVEIEKMDVDAEEIAVTQVKEEPVSASKNTTKKNKSLDKIKKTAKVDKKRKRVLHVSDSESDEDPFADDKPTQEDSEDEIPPTPCVNTVKITSGILNPKKRRKIVDKTYTDEDGYILTRKEEVYESCSEDEDEVKVPKVEKENAGKQNNIKIEVSPPKDKKPKITKKKISPPQKGKQTTMMNFFKKN